MPALLAVLLILFTFSSSIAQLVFNDDNEMRYEISYSNYSSMNLFGVLRKGEYLVFKPYSAGISKNNILTFIKPQSIINVYGKIKDMPFYYVEHDDIKGFIKEDVISFIDEEHLNLLKSKNTIYLKKPLVINDVIFPVATELKVDRFEKNSYLALIWDDGLYRARIKNFFATKKVKKSNRNYRKNSKIFLGYPYVWGGGENGWDCSYLVKDFYSLFDIRFPRNSYQQISEVEHIDVSDKGIAEKKKILRASKPYDVLLYFPGHIMIYSGFKGKEPMGFQALNRVNGRYFSKVDHFPLIKTGLLQKVTKIGFVDRKKSPDLTVAQNKDKL